jgi:hypothetical protein
MNGSEAEEVGGEGHSDGVQALHCSFKQLKPYSNHLCRCMTKDCMGANEDNISV